MRQRVGPAEYLTRVQHVNRSVLNIMNLNFGFVSDFDIRYSNFEQLAERLLLLAFFLFHSVCSNLPVQVASFDADGFGGL